MTLGRSVQMKEEKRRHPILRLFFGFVALVIIVLVVDVLGAGWWLKHAMRDSLPQLDGQVRLPGLSANVNVRRDTHGVPHIEAATLDDLSSVDVDGEYVNVVWGDNRSGFEATWYGRIPLSVY